MKVTIIALCLLMVSIVGYSQIKPNEKLVYTASYKLSGLMTELAQVSMETSLMTTTKKTYLHLHCEAKTYSQFEYLFKIEDFFDAYVDPVTLKPSLFKRNTSEGDFTKVEKYLFNADGSSVTSTASKKKRPETKRTFPISTNTQDLVSTIYKLRTLNLNMMKVGQTKTFKVVFDEKEFPVMVKMLGKETISTRTLGNKECYKLSISAKTDVLKGTDKNLLFLTTDAAKIPVLIKFSIPVGNGILELSGASGY